MGIVADAKVVLDVVASVKLSVCVYDLISALIVVMDGLVSAVVPLVSSLGSIVVRIGLITVGKLLTIC